MVVSYLSYCINSVLKQLYLLFHQKSFGTIDTLSNAQTVRQWLEKALGHNDKILQNHFIGVSTKPDKMTEWGIAADKQLLLWDWVGGRYSLWSCIGLPIALTIGVEGFKQLLAGAYAIDQHFQSAPFQQNIPVLMGLLGAWNNNFLDIQTHAVLPYDGRLKYFAAYLQQLEMESNGKSIQRNGEKVSSATCPIVGRGWANAQHAFYQLLHQGTHSVSCDFIAPVKRYNANQFTYAESAEALAEQHHLALSNCLAQSRLLALGIKLGSR
jgi:glucose-6-phosphate isomerase